MALMVFRHGGRVCVGVWVWVVPGFLGNWGGEKGSGNARERNFFFPCLCMSREEEDPWCRSKRYRFSFFLVFFNEQYMKRHCFSQNMPLHLKGNGAKMCQF
jgi:hypothetical protein